MISHALVAVIDCSVAFFYYSAIMGTRLSLAALACLLSAIATRAEACDTALILAIDVSNSVDSTEYLLQTRGISEAVLDPTVRDALVDGQVALSVVQWSGPLHQKVSIRWWQMTSDAEVMAFSEKARTLPRELIMSNTAVGSAIAFALSLFTEVEYCDRKVIDISGDGMENAGSNPSYQRNLSQQAHIQINAIAIEEKRGDLSLFYLNNVITLGGFVMTAHGHEDYPRALREKLRRELVEITASN